MSAPGVVRPHRAAAETALSLLTLGALIVVLWPIAVPFLDGVPLQPVPLLAHISGMLAGYGVLMMLVLMSRWPVLERGIGADVLARWHAAGGRTILTLVLAHAVAAVSGWAALTRLSPVGALLDVLTMPGLIGATVGTLLIVAIAIASVRSARKRLRWETWHALHLTMYVASPCPSATRWPGRTWPVARYSRSRGCCRTPSRSP